jgi:hypothetical protein
MIGRCRFFQSIQGWGSLSDAEIGEGVQLARQAIDVGKDDPETLCMAAFTLSIVAGEHATATTAVQRAFSLNPNSVHAWMTSGWNSTEEAREWLGRLLELQPGLTITKYKAAAEVWFSPEFLSWYLAGLRKAGLPEC